MSINAQNVKIMTLDGLVTLRGPVDTAAEKHFIGEVAINVTSIEDVDNQLEVK